MGNIYIFGIEVRRINGQFCVPHVQWQSKTNSEQTFGRISYRIAACVQCILHTIHTLEWNILCINKCNVLLAVIRKEIVAVILLYWIVCRV